MLQTSLLARSVPSALVPCTLRHKGTGNIGAVQGKICANSAGSLMLLLPETGPQTRCTVVAAFSPHQHEVLVGRAAAAGCEAQHPLAVRARLAHLCSIAARQQRQVVCAVCMYRRC